MTDPAPTVDLNADLGELVGPGHAGVDEALLEVVTTAHVACGYHAGDEGTMRRTVAAAVAAGVAIGAHPSYPDRQGFGRRPVARTPAEVAADVTDQLAVLDRVARSEGARLRSVKAHGALYHRMAEDPDCAAAVAVAVAEFDPSLVVVVRAGSAATAVAAGHGLAVAAEGFCDRGYLPDGSLAPRSTGHALLTDPDVVARRAVALAVDGAVEAVDGSTLALDCHTLCVHGDTPGALELAAAVRRSLEGRGIAVAPPSPPRPAVG